MGGRVSVFTVSERKATLPSARANSPRFNSRLIVGPSQRISKLADD